jgi:predicted dehydrogenase
MDRHRIGVIGLGIMGRRMLAAASTHPAFEIGSAWDLRPEAREAARSEHPGIRLDPPEAMMASNDLEAIHVATPPSTHAALARMVLDAGKALLCEKPLTVDVEEARGLAELARARRARAAVNFPFASSPAVEALERRIREGATGPARRVEMRFHFPEWPRAWQRDAVGWLAGRAQGGFLREVFSHFAYLTRRLLGSTLRVAWARVEYPPDPRASEVAAAAELTCGGVPVSVNGAVGGAAPDSNEWTLYGSRGSLRLVDWGARIEAGSSERWEELRPVREARPRLHDQLDNLALLIRGERSTLPNFEEGLGVVEAVEGIMR